MMKERNASPAVLALGMFDGVHLGHRKLIGTAKTLSEELGVPCVVFTFENHPLELLNRSVFLLTDNEERTALLKAAGADRVDMLPFTAEIRDLSCDGFFAFLAERYDIRGLVAGFNYSFGVFGRGGPNELRAYGEREGIPVRIIESFDVDGTTDSSTRTRQMIEAGDVPAAERLLGHPWRLPFTVSETDENGTALEMWEHSVRPRAGRYDALTSEGKPCVLFFSGDGSVYAEGLAAQNGEQLRLTLIRRRA